MGAVPAAKPLWRLSASGLRGASENLPLRPAAARGGDKVTSKPATFNPRFSAYSARTTSTRRLQEAELGLSPRPPNSRDQQPWPRGRKRSRAHARALAFPGDREPPQLWALPRAGARSRFSGPGELGSGCAHAAQPGPRPQARGVPGQYSHVLVSVGRCGRPGRYGGRRRPARAVRQR